MSTVVVHDVVVLGVMVIRGLADPGLYEGLFQRRIDGLYANRYRDSQSKYDAQGGLA